MVGWVTCTSFLSVFLKLVCYAHVFQCVCVDTNRSGYMSSILAFISIQTILYNYIYIQSTTCTKAMQGSTCISSMYVCVHVYTHTRREWESDVCLCKHGSLFPAIPGGQSVALSENDTYLCTCTCIYTGTPTACSVMCYMYIYSRRVDAKNIRYCVGKRRYSNNCEVVVDLFNDS